MKKPKRKPYTAEELATLTPAYKKIDAGYRQVDRALVKAGHPPLDQDDGGGTTWICGTGCGCSSFLPPDGGPGSGPGGANICARPFCRHHYRSHLT